MSLHLFLTKGVKILSSTGLSSRAFTGSNALCAAYYNKDWMPGLKIPATVEEKRAAAKKYGMIPEDYETYPDDGTGYGDYPKLPPISIECRDPHALYDFPEMKRNFGEPMYVDIDLIGDDRWNQSQRLRFPISVMLASFLGMYALFAVVIYVGTMDRFVVNPKKPPQFPNRGRTHYTFELED